MSLEEIALKLPTINGEFFAGIALGTEAALDAAEKLNVFTSRVGKNDDGKDVLINITKEECIKYTLVYLYDQLTKANTPNKHLKLLISGAAVLMYTGNLTYLEVGNKKVPDGDWLCKDARYVTKEMATPEVSKAIEEILTVTNMQKAASIVVGTKINWFKENHHTGQGSQGGAFARKVIKAMTDEEPTEQDIRVVHRLGHWASTRRVLQQLGIKNIMDTLAIVQASNQPMLKPTDDIVLRMHSPPAGTARMAVAYALAKKMLASPAVVFLPNAGDYSKLPPIFAKVSADPARYHFGANYLCGGRLPYNDQDYESLLGRAGTWGHTFIAQSTLMKSPHAMAYANASDYDADFEAACKTFKVERQKQLKEKMDLFKEVTAAGSDNYGSVCSAFGIKANEDAVQVLALIKKKNEEKAKKEKEEKAAKKAADKTDDDAEDPDKSDSES